MDIFYKNYKAEEKDFFLYHHKNLLADVLYLNYEYSTHKHYKTTGNDILELITKDYKYSDIEKDEIIKDALLIIRMKHNRVTSDDYKKDFNEINLK